mmetsp:Transcript_146967/g.409384  ORF Transcript_146967/g.409384 Transcript_146967/m.409384 type:complete len:282 (+) Transcript_146967:1017-1862(+)
MKTCARCPVTWRSLAWVSANDAAASCPAPPVTSSATMVSPTRTAAVHSPSRARQTITRGITVQGILHCSCRRAQRSVASSHVPRAGTQSRTTAKSLALPRRTAATRSSAGTASMGPRRPRRAKRAPERCGGAVPRRARAARPVTYRSKAKTIARLSARPTPAPPLMHRSRTSTPSRAQAGTTAAARSSAAPASTTPAGPPLARRAPRPCGAGVRMRARAAPGATQDSRVPMTAERLRAALDTGGPAPRATLATEPPDAAVPRHVRAVRPTIRTTGTTTTVR